MADEVKGTRRYESPVRREQAAATRLRILEAAQRLFERDGYARTTMSAIASEAGVSLKTVYLAFETKSGVLRALWHLRLRGDQEEVPVGERPWFRAVLDEPDPERKLRLDIRNAKIVRGRIGSLLQVLRDAASADPEIGALWTRIQTEFYENQRGVVEDLHARNALRPGLDVTRAADILWALNHPVVYGLLVAERGWTSDEHEAWLATLVCSELLPSDPSQTRPVALELYMVGVIVEDMPRAVEFYRRLGVAVPVGAETQEHVEIPMGGLTFFLSTASANATWDPARTPLAPGGYRIVLEFYLETAEALDAKYEELTGLGYASHCAPYAVTPELRFAMVDDPDGNTILMSASTEAAEQ
jgi:AcrR family transcriptional regulator